MQLETSTITVFKSNQETFDYLTNLNNFEKLMPDNNESFEADENSFVFKLTGMPEVKLVLTKKTSYEEINFGAASTKLDFSLVIKLKSLSENSTSVQFFFDGKFNPMMAMMVKKPLTNFINTLSHNLQSI